MLSAKQGSCEYHFFKVFWYDSTREMNPRSTDCDADALTTTPSRRLHHRAGYTTIELSCDKLRKHYIDRTKCTLVVFISNIS